MKIIQLITGIKPMNKKYIGSPFIISTMDLIKGIKYTNIIKNSIMIC